MRRNGCSQCKASPCASQDKTVPTAHSESCHCIVDMVSVTFAMFYSLLALLPYCRCCTEPSYLAKKAVLWHHCLCLTSGIKSILAFIQDLLKLPEWMQLLSPADGSHATGAHVTFNTVLLMVSRHAGWHCWRTLCRVWVETFPLATPLTLQRLLYRQR